MLWTQKSINYLVGIYTKDNTYYAVERKLQKEIELTFWFYLFSYIPTSIGFKY